MFTKYGYDTLSYIVVFVFTLFVIAIFVNAKTLKIILFAGGILFLIFSLYFFRDPKRNIPGKDNIVLSPADGKILVIKKVSEERFLKGEAYQISIFMSPLDVHVNRVPISGEVKYLKRVGGKYFAAFNNKADTANERVEIGIETKGGFKILFTQVAGIIARRIVNTLKNNQIVNKGEEFGMIKFGSRSDVFVPISCKLLVKEGEQVYAGETILSEINK